MAKKQIKLYTSEEISLLQQLADSNKAVNNELLGEFCKKYKRSLGSASLKVYELRRKQPGYINRFAKKEVAKDVSLVKPTDSFTVSKGEVKIPINKFNIEQQKDGFYFVIKF